MDYDFTQMGAREFEHLCSALLFSVIGTEVSTYGDGPDGGREATWNGLPGPMSTLPSTWDGYGVLQAKFRQRPYARVSSNATWLLSQAKDELNLWKRSRPTASRPQFLIIATNLTLSAVPGAGCDQVEKEILAYSKSLRLGIKGVRVWHNDTIRTLLDANSSVRARYSSLLCTGDLIANLIDRSTREGDEFTRAILESMARDFLSEGELNLTQAGTLSDNPPRIHDLFVDLPGSADRIRGQLNDWNRVAQGLVDAADTCGVDPMLGADHRSRRHVIVGGPGQGKSTLVQYLAQVYRAEFLSRTAIATDPELALALSEFANRLAEASFRSPRIKRWPTTIVLTRFADWIAENPDKGIINYMVERINRRGSAKIDEAALRSWVSRCPWLLILDGLDEVPRSSNRDQLMMAVGDFLRETATLDGDVVVIATTRPQGYNDDLGPSRFRHIQLESLGVELASTYALKLLRLRMGEGDRYERAVERWQRATSEPATSRLMSTPLQASILAILIEKHGQAPRDRWRLFSQYYRVIYQREQEKREDVGSLLSDYQTDIDAIHALVGFKLQQRAEFSGDTESTLSPTELREIAMTRLSEQGHTGAELDDLAARICELAVDRLVFLAAVRDEALGFEIRSFQEFMAAEYLVAQFDSPVVRSQIPSLALSSYWRNTILFLVGKVFSEREDLRDSIVTLCQELNLQNEVTRLALPGSLLATNVLSHGICWNLPRYRKLFTQIAVAVLSAPGSPVVNLLEAIEDLSVDVLTAEVSAAVTGSRTENLSVLQMCGSRAFDRLMNSRDTLSAVVANLGVQEALQAAIDFELPWVLAELEAQYETIAPPVLGRSYVRDRIEPKYDQLDVRPSVLLDIVSSAHGPTHREANVVVLNVRSTPRLSVSLPSLSSRIHDWPRIVDFCGSREEWSSVKLLAEFAVDPNSATLSGALRGIAEDPNPLVIRLVSSAPWPLATVVEGIRFSLDGGPSGEDYANFVVASASAQSGRFGSFDDWSAAEARWKSFPAWLDCGEYPGTGSPRDEILGPWIADVGLAPFFGMSAHFSSRDHSLAAAAFIFDLMLTASSLVLRRSLADLILFDLQPIGRLPARHDHELRDVWPDSAPFTPEHLLQTVELSSRAHLYWLPLVAGEVPDDRLADVLDVVGRSAFLASSGGSELPDGIVTEIRRRGSDAWASARALKLCDPSLELEVMYPDDVPIARNAKLVESLRSGTLGNGDAPILDAVREFVRFEMPGLMGNFHGISLRHLVHDRSFLQWISSPDDSRLVAAARLATSIRPESAALAAVLGARVSSVLADIPGGRGWNPESEGK